MIVRHDMLTHKPILLPTYSPNMPSRRQNNTAFRHRVLAHTKNVRNSKRTKTGPSNQSIIAYNTKVRLIFLLLFYQFLVVHLRSLIMLRVKFLSQSISYLIFLKYKQRRVMLIVTVQDRKRLVKRIVGSKLTK